MQRASRRLPCLRRSQLQYQDPSEHQPNPCPLPQTPPYSPHMSAGHIPQHYSGYSNSSLEWHDLDNTPLFADMQPKRLAPKKNAVPELHPTLLPMQLFVSVQKSLRNAE